jgi:uncharacterized protein
MNRIIGLLVLWFVSVGTAQATSIDCSRPVTPIDRAICQNDSIVSIDADLASMFQKVQAGYSSTLRASLIRGQRHWLALRNEACLLQRDRAVDDHSDDDGLEVCLMSVYRERLRELRDLFDLQSATKRADATVDVEAILDDPAVLTAYREKMYPNGNYLEVSKTPRTCREVFTLAAGMWSFGDNTIGMSYAGQARNACSFSVFKAQNFAVVTHHEDHIDFTDVLHYATDFRCTGVGCADPATGERTRFYRKGTVTTFGQEIENGRLKLKNREGDADVDNVLVVKQNVFYIDGEEFIYELSAPGDYTGRGRREVLMPLQVHAWPGTLSIFGVLVAYYDPATGAIRPELLDPLHPLRAVPKVDQL